MSSIELHKEYGVAPALTVCMQCGKETSEIALLGRKADSVMREVYEKTDGKLGSKDGYKEFGKNLIPSSSLCDACVAAKAAVDEAVRLGGVYWKCTKCGSEGALKAESSMAKAVREHMKIEAPAPVGVDLTDECPVCNATT